MSRADDARELAHSDACAALAGSDHRFDFCPRLLEPNMRTNNPRALAALIAVAAPLAAGGVAVAKPDERT